MPKRLDLCPFLQESCCYPVIGMTPPPYQNADFEFRNGTRVSPLLRAHVIPNGSYDLSIR